MSWFWIVHSLGGKQIISVCRFFDLGYFLVYTCNMETVCDNKGSKSVDGLKPAVAQSFLTFSFMASCCIPSSRKVFLSALLISVEFCNAGVKVYLYI